MADPIYQWPDGLGSPLVEGYTEGGEDGVLRSQFDAGPSKIRNKYTGRPAGAVAGEVVMFKAGIQILDDFYWGTLNRVGQFYFADHRRPIGPTDNVAIYRFTARPTYTPISHTLWRANLQLERLTTVRGHFLLDFSDGTTTGLTS